MSGVDHSSRSGLQLLSMGGASIGLARRKRPGVHRFITVNDEAISVFVVEQNAILPLSIAECGEHGSIAERARPALQVHAESRSVSVCCAASATMTRKNGSSVGPGVHTEIDANLIESGMTRGGSEPRVAQASRTPIAGGGPCDVRPAKSTIFRFVSAAQEARGGRPRGLKFDHLWLAVLIRCELLERNTGLSERRGSRAARRGEITSGNPMEDPQASHHVLVSFWFDLSDFVQRWRERARKEQDDDDGRWVPPGPG